MTADPSPLRIGTRGSRLARWQAEFVADCLRARAGAPPVAVVEIETTGDRVRDVPLFRIGGDGVFTREIQRALLDRRVDVAVHSLKDLPTDPVEGVVLAAVPCRGPVRDVFISQRHRRFDEVPRGATVGTSSLRRRAQALHRRPDLRLVDLRGNVETRLRKLEEQALDGIILAQAGVERLGLADAVTELLSIEWMLPAVGQGALGLECRTDDALTYGRLRELDDAPTRQAVCAERALLAALGGGCAVPIGVETRAAGDVLTLRAAVLSPDGVRRLEGQVSGPAATPEVLGHQLADQLRARGADALLAASRSA